jgi:hypothetical protein
VRVCGCARFEVFGFCYAKPWVSNAHEHVCLREIDESIRGLLEESTVAFLIVLLYSICF